jgi:hypothetical protein
VILPHPSSSRAELGKWEQDYEDEDEFSMNIYESDKLLAEYLLFHYGTAEEALPYSFGPHSALHYAIRCVSECLDVRPPAGQFARARTWLCSGPFEL